MPVLRGCVSQGVTREEALANIKEAVEVYIEALMEDGLPVPTEVGKKAVELEISTFNRSDTPTVAHEWSLTPLSKNPAY